MLALGLLFGATAALSWLYSLTQLLGAVKHLAPGVKLKDLAFKGHLAFSPSTFTEEGQRYQRGFLKGFAGFFLSILGGFGVAALQLL